jgi:hypothetical protein
MTYSFTFFHYIWGSRIEKIGTCKQVLANELHNFQGRRLA